MRRFVIPAVLLGLGAMPCHASTNPTDFAWQTRPGTQVPLQTTLRDEAGNPTTLRAILDSVPVILDLGYFHCPSLCGVVRSDLLTALHGSGLVEGRDYTLLAISIDPAETPSDARHAKAADLAQQGFATGADWHYLTGSHDAIDTIAKAVGFPSRYDSGFRQFLHPTGLAILTRSGIVSGYLLGVGYTPGDLRAAVLRARDGGIARAALPVLLLCFHFDSTTGRYTLAIEKVLRLAGVLTVITLGGVMIALHWRRPGSKP